MGIMVDADSVLVGGNFITMDSDNPVADAAAIKDGKFLYVGKEDEARKAIGKRTLVRDLGGSTVVPGFNEAHNHTLEFGLNMRGLLLESAGSIDEILGLVKKDAGRKNRGEWVIGRGYNQNTLQERRSPSRWDLDKVSPDHPVSLKHTSSHVMVVNSKALSVAGITGATPQPRGGLIGKDEKTGEPTGVLYEFPAMELVERIMPKPSYGDLVRALGKANERLLAEGITSAMDAAVGANGDVPGQIAAYQEAVESGVLRVRHNLAIWSDALVDYDNLDDELNDIDRRLLGMGIRSGLGNEKLRIGPFKFVPDGALSMGTAVTYDPYGPDPGNRGRGVFVIDPKKLARVVSAIHRLGWQLSIHGIGDCAIDAALDAIESAHRHKNIVNARPRLEHCVMVTPQMIERIRRLGVVVILQPGFIWGLGDSYIRQLGAERASRTKPFRTLLDRQVPVAFSSDRPVIDGAPLLGIHAAVNQKTLSGQEYAPSQKVSVAEALHCYTLNGAYTTFEETIKGSIKVGKLADIAVLTDDITTMSPERIKDVEVAATMVGGEFVYEL